MAGKNNFYTTTKEINGTLYTAQFSGLATAMRAVDSSYIDGSSNTSVEKLSKYILDNVIVDPKMDIDDFSDMDELNAVVAFGRDVMQGKFRNKEEKLPANKRTSKE